MKKILSFFTQLPKNLTVAAIVFYQRVLSPDHSWLKSSFPYGYCRHYPSCSEYTKQAVINFGLIKGLWLGTKRVARCNPFVQPTVDPIPRF